MVTKVTPVVSSGVGPGGKFGYTEFTVTFDPTHQPNGGPSGIANFTGTYSYLIAPDDGANNPIVSPIDSFTDSLQNQPLVGQAPPRANLPIPTVGHGRHRHPRRPHDLPINIPANYNNNANIANQIITGVTLNLTLTHQNGSDLVVTLTAPDGQTVTVPTNFGPGPLNARQRAVRGPQHARQQPRRRPGHRQLHADHRRHQGQQHRHADRLVDHGQLVPADAGGPVRRLDGPERQRPSPTRTR